MGRRDHPWPPAAGLGDLDDMTGVRAGWLGLYHSIEKQPQISNRELHVQIRGKRENHTVHLIEDRV